MSGIKRPKRTNRTNTLCPEFPDAAPGIGRPLGRSGPLIVSSCLAFLLISGGCKTTETVNNPKPIIAALDDEIRPLQEQLYEIQDLKAKIKECDEQINTLAARSAVSSADLETTGKMAQWKLKKTVYQGQLAVCPDEKDLKGKIKKLTKVRIKGIRDEIVESNQNNTREIVRGTRTEVTHVKPDIKPTCGSGPCGH
ncbi:MAG TPA: hypothetical protein PLU30_13645 [Verrucomicrobiae bacterium]|nr:hypothetical protein [Verrucomicrobiae bacterium]